MKKISRLVRHKDLLISLFVLVLFFSSHLINFSIAPWNQNGLFDDAAWDIYFAKNHIFAGHRYTITAPLMTVSLYYLYTSFTNKSRPRAAISAIFAALCLGSAIMGKQYLYGLVLTKSKRFSLSNIHTEGGSCQIFTSSPFLTIFFLSRD